jgi:hypothetical protein
MHYPIHISRFLFLIGMGMFVSTSLPQTAPAASAPSAAKPYKIVNSTQTLGTGGIDYVYADNDGRRLYVPRGDQVLVFELDTLKSAGVIPNARARGVAVDPKSHHGFCSSSPVVMWDTKTLATIKTIEVQGRPDGILFEPATERVYVFSHSAPNATVIDAKDGSVLGTIDLGGAPEQAASDGQGHVYVDIEDKDNVAVVDVKTLAERAVGLPAWLWTRRITFSSRCAATLRPVSSSAPPMEKSSLRCLSAKVRMAAYSIRTPRRPSVRKATAR